MMETLKETDEAAISSTMKANNQGHERKDHIDGLNGDKRRVDVEKEKEGKVVDNIDATTDVVNSHGEKSGLSPERNLEFAEERSLGKDQSSPQAEARLRKPSLRRHDRIDGLQHLSSSQTENSKPMVQMNHIREIVSALIKLDLWAVTSNALEYNIDKAEALQADDLGKSMQEEMLVVDFANELYMGGPKKDQPIDRYVGGFSDERAIQRLRDLKTIPYLSHGLLYAIRAWKQWQNSLSAVERSITELPSWAINENLTWADYSDRVVFEADRWQMHLISHYKTVKSLYEQTTHVAAHDLIDDVSLETLRVRMATIQDYFHSLCTVLGKPRFDLVSETEPWWRNPNSTDSKPLFNDSSPKNVVQAYPDHEEGSNTTKSILMFLVPIVSLLSSIPTFLSWTHSPHTRGAVADADFFQLISSTAMQILGTLMLMIPTIFNDRLVGHPWFWTWLLAIASTACYVVALPLYLYAPTEWSAVVAFAGNALQAFVTLQLMFAI